MYFRRSAIGGLERDGLIVFFDEHDFENAAMIRFGDEPERRRPCPVMFSLIEHEVAASIQKAFVNFLNGDIVLVEELLFDSRADCNHDRALG